MPESKYIDVQDIKIHYLEWGNPKSPDLIMVHGWTNLSQSWAEIATALENDYHIIAPDNRGHGDSEKPGTGYYLQDFVQDTKEIIENLDLEKPTYIGHSWGANIGTMLAANHPNLISKAFLEDPVYWKFIHSFVTSLPVGLARLEKTESEIRTEAESKGLTEAETTREIFRHHHFSGNALTHLLQDNRNWALDCENYLRRISIPTMVLIGNSELGGAIIPEEMNYFSDITSDSVNFKVWDDTGHGMHAAQPKRYIDELRAFITQL
ncbi:MAG: alpha/beta fold hydrolase [Dehalococcoidia bacterium]